MSENIQRSARRKRVWLNEQSEFDGIRLSSRQISRSEAEVLVARDPFKFSFEETEREEIVLL